MSLALKDYGSTGSWAWSVWFRHEAGVNFPDYQREQFFGHGDPRFPTTSFDQMHIQVSSQSVSHYHTPSRELMAHTLTLLKHESGYGG